MNTAVLQLIQSWPEQTKLILRIIGWINHHSIIVHHSCSTFEEMRMKIALYDVFITFLIEVEMLSLGLEGIYFIVFIDGSWVSHIFPICPIFIDFIGWFTLFANFSWMMKNTPWHYCTRNALTKIMSDTLLFQQMVKIPNFFHKTSLFLTWNFAVFTLWFGCFLIYANVSLWF